MSIRTISPLAALLLGLTLIACSSQDRPPPATLTATQSAATPTPIPPTPSVTPPPSLTPTASPTHTDTPNPATSTPLSDLAFLLADIQYVEEGGFSFQPVLGYLTDVQGPQVGVFDTSGTIIVSLIGITSSQGSEQTPEEIIDEFLNQIAAMGNGEFRKEGSGAVIVDGVEGLAIDLSGTLFGSPLRGQTILVMKNPEQMLFGLGIANTGGDQQRWENEGSGLFATLINTVKFIPSDSLPATPDD